MPEYKLIGCDLDGTFYLHKDGQPYAPGDNPQAVLEAQAAGVKVCACTTRNYLAGKWMFDTGNFDELAVVCNGAAIINRHTLEKHFSQAMEPRAIKELFRVCMEYGLSVGLFTIKDFPAYMPCMEGGFQNLYANLGDPNDRFVYFDDLDALCDYAGDEALLLMSVGTMVDTIPPEFFDAVEKIGGLEATSSNPHILEVMAAGVSKGGTFLKMAEIMGIKPEETVGIGDNHNDISLIEMAGYGIAMGSAVEAAKAAADFVSLPAIESGVAQSIRSIISK